MIKKKLRGNFSGIGGKIEVAKSFSDVKVEKTFKPPNFFKLFFRITQKLAAFIKNYSLYK